MALTRCIKVTLNKATVKEISSGSIEAVSSKRLEDEKQLLISNAKGLFKIGEK